MSFIQTDGSATVDHAYDVMLELQLLSKNVNIPVYATPGSAGLDIEANEEVVIHPLGRAKVGTGLAVAIPIGYEIQLRPRSGLALNYGVTLLNAPGTIDSDYRGEICVIMVNLGQHDFKIVPGMKIAQMVVGKVVTCSIKVVNKLGDTVRGSGGFGSTGLFGVKNNNDE